MSEKKDRVINERDLEWTEVDREDRFRFRRKQLALAAGGKELGCSIVEVPPGWRSWPYHFHHGNEEAIYVLEGSGDLRLAGRKQPITAGDYVAFPRGVQGAHQIHNTSQKDLRYLVFSTMNAPDITVYPDSGKMGLFAGTAPGGSDEGRTLSRYVPDGVEVAYWEGE
ncbi:MAG: cupin domain-containing protein [Deltaproteobacteria bacterium]|nr:cupin domain-containing protein [Deltaproteobacteria bacterium]